MALLRFDIQGAIELPLTPTEQSFIDDLRTKLRILKSNCVTINQGADNAESPVFTYHICHHDQVGIPCEPNQDI